MGSPPDKTPGSESIAAPPISFRSDCHGFEPPQRSYRHEADIERLFIMVKALGNRLRRVEDRLAEIHPTHEGPE